MNLDREPGAGHRIVAIDDDKMICTLYKEVLTSVGDKVETCSSPFEFVKRFREIRNGGPISLIILDFDYGVEGVNGYTFGNRLRKSRFLKDTPIVLATAYTRSERALISGNGKDADSIFDNYLLKPFDIEYLIKVVAGTERKYIK